MKFLHREKNKTEALKVIIIGAGEVGFHIAQRLAEEDKNVVVIDRNPKKLRRLTDQIDVQIIEGSGSSPRVLMDAGAEDADILLAVTDSDETNIIACFFANVLSPTSLKLARIRNEEYTLYRDALSKEYLNIGVVINPEVEVIKSIDRMINVPGIVDYSEFADGRLKMVGIRAEQGAFVGVPLMELRETLGFESFIIAGIVREEKLIVPTGADQILSGDLIYVVCAEKDLRQLGAIFGLHDKPIKELMIIGGGNIGLRLAGLCEQRGYHTRLVDIEEKRCQYLAERLNKVIVLKGDGTDQDFLREENISGMDMVVSLTGDEETNILSSLLAKNMGARMTITRINKTAYLPLVRTIGIEHSVSPRLSAVNSFLHHVRRGKIISSVQIKGEEAEALEAIAQENSDIVHKPLKQLNFPKGALILCIIRGDAVIVPSGDSVIEPQDRIIIFSTRDNLSRVESALAAKLEII